jgi:Glycosyl transferase family 2
MQSVEYVQGPMSENAAKDHSASVDVAIPCYQYGRFLRECVTSVLSQGIQDVRVLIIDNASSDNSLEVAQQLASEDRRVEVVAHRRNLGQHASYNEGIDWASSKYFIMLDADDLLAPGCRARATTVMERYSDVVLAHGSVALPGPQSPMPILDSNPANGSWRIVAGNDLLARFCRTGQCHIRGGAAVVVRTAMQKLAGYYRPELPHSDDFELWMRLARLGAVAETDAVQGLCRTHESSRYAVAHAVECPDRAPLHLRNDIAAFMSLFAHEGALLPDAGRLQRLAKRSLGARAYWSALAHMCRGQARISWDLLRLAVGLCPTTAILPPVIYLLRREDAIRRIISVASEAMGWPRASARPARLRG